jgi:hypothetical protein
LVKNTILKRENLVLFNFGETLAKIPVLWYDYDIPNFHFLPYCKQATLVTPVKLDKNTPKGYNKGNCV